MNAWRLNVYSMHNDILICLTTWNALLRVVQYISAFVPFLRVAIEHPWYTQGTAKGFGVVVCHPVEVSGRSLSKFSGISITKRVRWSGALHCPGCGRCEYGGHRMVVCYVAPTCAGVTRVASFIVGWMGGIRITLLRCCNNTWEYANR
jgi:hypothetical protein